MQPRVKTLACPPTQICTNDEGVMYLTSVQLLARFDLARRQKHENQRVEKTGWGIIAPIRNPFVKNQNAQVPENTRHEQELRNRLADNPVPLIEKSKVVNIEHDAE